MTHPTNRIFDSGICLTLEEMQAYNDETLTGKELNRVERHLLDCEMCDDAIEGLKMAPNATSNIEFINTAIDHLTLAKPKVIFPWKIAAAFALIFGSTLTLWLIIPKGEVNKMADKEINNGQQITNSDQAVATTPTETTSNYSKGQVQPIIQSSTEEFKKPIATSEVSKSKFGTMQDVVKNKAVVADENIKEMIAENKSQGTAYAEMETVTSKAVAPSEMSKKTTADLQKEEESEKKEVDNSTAKVYETNQVFLATTKEKKTHSLPQDLYLNTAIKQIESGDFTSAQNNLISYLKMESPKKDQAYWYLSKVYLQKKDNKKAIEMLNAVIKENKSFVKEAQEELTKL